MEWKELFNHMFRAGPASENAAFVRRCRKKTKEERSVDVGQTSGAAAAAIIELVDRLTRATTVIGRLWAQHCRAGQGIKGIKGTVGRRDKGK